MKDEEHTANCVVENKKCGCKKVKTSGDRIFKNESIVINFIIVTILQQLLAWINVAKYPEDKSQAQTVKTNMESQKWWHLALRVKLKNKIIT